ncbi:CBS domain-containing protein [Streptomyces sp. MMBL 11-3]|uniref:CBS domain-containing protein n=1 Tax=Streptomyces sp. MMBL 11-3 TaxID=3382639 RepID=UPI0039B54C1A
MHGTPHIVGDVMTRDVAAVDRKASFKEIVRTMQARKVTALPVLGGKGQVVGIVSEGDLLPKEEFRDGGPDLPQERVRQTGDSPLARLRQLADLTKAGSVDAGELMTSPALTATLSTTLAQAARTMARARVRSLPVVDAAGALVGIVSRADLLKVFLRDDEDMAEEVRREVVSYLFPTSTSRVWTEVRDGVVRLSGHIRDTSLVPVAARLARAVEGVVDVEFDLSEPEPEPEPGCGPEPGRGHRSRPTGLS